LILLLSPAKKLHAEPALVESPTRPALLDDARTLMGVTRSLQEGDLRRLMGISENLARLNRERFRAMSTDADPEGATPALLTFAGDVYVGLDAGTLSEADLAFAQQRVGILSGLYGLLRPLDVIQPYRLEMGTRLSNPRGRTLYAFWGDRIAREIDARLEDHADRTVVNLASNEYFRAVKRAALDAPVVTPVFKEIRNGKARVISFFAKKARGMMTRYAIERRLESPEGLREFDRDGYRFDPGLGDERTWVFTRG